MKSCSRFGQKPLTARVTGILAVVLLSISLPATADPLQPELNPVQQVLDRTASYALGLDPQANYTVQYQRTQVYLSDIVNLLQQTLCIDFDPGLWTLSVTATDVVRRQIDIEVPGAGRKNGYVGPGTYHITNLGNPNVACSPVPVDDVPPLIYEAPFVDAILREAGLG